MTTNPDRSVLIPIITGHFSFQPVNVSILNLKDEYGTRSDARFTRFSHCYVTWCPLTTGIVISLPSSRDAVFVTSFFKPLTSACLNAAKQFFHNMIYIYSESVNLIDNCNVALESTNLWNHPKTVPVIGMESMVTRARLCYTWVYLPPGTYSLIKPDAMAKLISFPTKIITVMS